MTTATEPRSPAAGIEPRELAIGLVAGAIVVAIWTAFLLVSRAGVLGALLPTDIAGLRMSVAVLVAAPIAWRYGLAGLRLHQAAVLVATAGLGFPLLAYWGFAYAPAAHASIMMTSTLPLWTALLARLLLGEPLRGRRLLSLGLIVAGIAALAAGVDEAPEGSWRGDLLFAAASFSWAIFTIAARAWKVPPLAAAGVVGTGSGLVYLPVWSLFLTKGIAATPWPELLFQGIYHGLLAFLVAFVAYTRCVAALGAGPTTMLTALVPGLGALLAVPILGEPLSAWAVLGLLFVTAGMLATVSGLRRVGP
ncbi:MAG: DMT family transporter [Geminicoccaceae bacterium]|nr:DMT family transporter [Geminicoccaceae bacterium]MCX8101956.1 DMT family transporter [Geminicoccaceae bacterium]MDW8369952.1 DMT family transporter [Geminicoccaceae bacterium]